MPTTRKRNAAAAPVVADADHDAKFRRSSSGFRGRAYDLCSVGARQSSSNLFESIVPSSKAPPGATSFPKVERGMTSSTGVGACGATPPPPLPMMIDESPVTQEEPKQPKTSAQELLRQQALDTLRSTISAYDEYTLESKPAAAADPMPAHMMPLLAKQADTKRKRGSTANKTAMARTSADRVSSRIAKQALPA